MTEITSRQNPLYKVAKSLLEARGIRRHNRHLLFGQKAVAEYLTESPDSVEHLLLPPETPKLPREISASGISAARLSRDLYNELDIFHTGTPIAIAHTPALSDWDPQATPLGPELLIPLGDPRNLGALLRTAFAFGIENIVLLAEAVTPFHPQSVRAASGSLRFFKFSSGPSIHQLAADHRKTQNPIAPLLTQLLALDMKGVALAEFSWPSAFRLLLGEEGPGVPPSLRAQRITIPIHPSCDSLNASVATAIALYSYRQQYPVGPPRINPCTDHTPTPGI